MFTPCRDLDLLIHRLPKQSCPNRMYEDHSQNVETLLSIDKNISP
jgi:hypothetical protein